MTMPIRACVVAALAVALTFAFALSVAAPPADAAKACRGADSWASTPKARKALLCLVNRERAKRGLKALRYNARLSRVAKVHAGDLVRFRFVGHDSPKHGGLMQRIKRSGWAKGKKRWTYGEIMGDGANRGATPRRILRAWMKRPIHSTAILHRKFRSVGIGSSFGRPHPPARRKGGRTYVMTFAG